MFALRIAIPRPSGVVAVVALEAEAGDASYPTARYFALLPVRPRHIHYCILLGFSVLSLARYRRSVDAALDLATRCGVSVPGDVLSQSARKAESFVVVLLAEVPAPFASLERKLGWEDLGM